MLPRRLDSRVFGASILVPAPVEAWCPRWFRAGYGPVVGVYTQPCNISDSSVLTCVIPRIRLPPEFRNFSDPSLTFPFDDPSLRSSPVTSFNGRNSTLAFTQSVLLDDVEYRWNDTEHFRFISLMPTINDSGVYELNGRPLNIQVCCVEHPNLLSLYKELRSAMPHEVFSQQSLFLTRPRVRVGATT